MFQPGEEGCFGAKKMIEQGILKDVEVSSIFAIHGLPCVEYGKIGLKSGAVFASVDSFFVEVKGIGGHGAYPEDAINPIVAASEMILNLQKIVSQNKMENTVVTVCSIKSGKETNIIPEIANFSGTVRTLNKENRELIEKIIKETINKIAKKYNVTVLLRYKKGYPVTVNNEKTINFLKEKLDTKDICELKPQMGGEDFSYFLEQISGALLILGTKQNERTPALHNKEYFFPEELLIKGVKLFFEILK